MLDRLVQLYSFCTGWAVPQAHENGWRTIISGDIAKPGRALPTPFSCRRPSREEHPGPPFVLYDACVHERDHELGTGYRPETLDVDHAPEEDVVEAPVRARREEPEEQL